MDRESFKTGLWPYMLIIVLMFVGGMIVLGWVHISQGTAEGYGKGPPGVWEFTLKDGTPCVVIQQAGISCG